MTKEQKKDVEKVLGLIYEEQLHRKERLYEQNKEALENGIDARLSIQFIEEPNGKMSVLSCTITKDCGPSVDYVMSLNTTLKDVIKGMIW